MTHPVIGVVVATGVASVATQLVVIREFLCLFSGNEFVIAVTLFNWLFLGGCGTLMFRVLHRSVPVSPGLLAGCSMTLCLVGTIQIPVIRFLFDCLFLAGQAVGFYQTLAFTFTASVPYCILVGYLLPVSLELEKRLARNTAPTRIYLADNIGDTLGGAVFSFFLIRVTTPVQTSFIATLPLAFLALGLNRSPWFRRLAVLFLCIMALSLLLEPQTLIKTGTSPVFYRETPYARVAVHERDGSFTFYQNNVPLFDTRNAAQAEKSIHYPLSQVENPRRILLISAVSGLFRELDKYDPQAIDYAEIDPEVTGAMFSFGFLKPLAHVRLIHQDARRWLQRTDRQYDAVIMNLTDPDTFQVNRFFTKNFFSLVRQHLSDGGVFSFSITGYENYPSGPLIDKLSAIRSTLRTQFEQVLILPGESLFFLSKNGGPFSLDIPAALDRKGIVTRHVHQTFHGDITRERIANLDAFLDGRAPENRDFSPALIQTAFAEWFLKFHTSPIVFGLVAGIALILWITALKGAESVLFITGFFAMGAEMMIIFAFQIFFGYIYIKIGLIVTLFLAGLLPGAYTGDRIPPSRAGHWMAVADIGLLILMAGFAAALAWFPSMINESGYLGLAGVFGFCCGFQFPLAARLKQDSVSGVTRLFAADLAGAAFGILVFSLVLVPVFGLIKAGFVLAAVKTIGLSRFLLWKQ